MNPHQLLTKFQKYSSSNRFTVYAGSALLLITAQQVSAAEKIWNGGGTDNSWLTADNWTGGVPANSTATDTATFGTSSRYSIYLGTADRSINGMTFNSATSYNLNLYDSDLSTSRTLTIGTGGITVSNGNHTITGTKPGTGFLGTLKIGTGTFNVASGSTLTFDSRITQSVTSSAYIKSGEGTLVFNADNGGSSGWNFSSGSFTISAGTLEMAASGVSGNSGNKWSVTSGATLKLSASSALSVGSAGLLTLNGTGVSSVGALHASATTTIGGSTGTVDLASNSRIGVDTAQTLTIARVISGAGALEKSGAGSLILGGTNSYTGDTLVSAGTLFVNGSLASGSDVTVTSAGIIGGTGTINSTLTLDAGAGLDLTGATLDLSSTGILTVAAGQTITLTNFEFADIVGWDYANANAGTYTLINGGGSVIFGGSTPTFSNPYDLGGGRTGYFQEGSMQAVIVIPEPRAALLGGLGMLMLLRRRRNA